MVGDQAVTPSTAPPSGGGIYVHFPYCRHRCPYCDFTLTTRSRIPQGRYTDALIAELSHLRDAWEGPRSTLYIGGGTPSLWATEHLARFIQAIRQGPGLTDDAEITVEANPSEVDRAWVRKVVSLGVNRVSLGVQSLRDPLLRSLERTHDVSGALESIELLKQAPLASFSVDLIFGLEGQSLSSWREDLAKMIELRPPHLSVYSLTVEPNTPLAHRVRRGSVRLPDEDVAAEMMLVARHDLTSAGYGHYEVSSYALSGHRSRHNSGYWSMVPYLALGAGAHGFYPPRRTMNDTHIGRYIQRAFREPPLVVDESLDEPTLQWERLMTGLRDLERGVCLAEVPLFSRSALQAELRSGRLQREGDRVRLTERGLLTMDDVLVNLSP